jgi:nucleoside-diphosphate-sugar epimerase
VKVLCLGGTGVISTAVCKRLIASGHEVTAFNRGRTPSRVGPGLAQIHGDRSDRAAFEAAFSGSRFDAVIDMLCFDAGDAESALRAFSGRVGRYLHCSSIAVYGGELAETPAVEDQPLRPVSDYGRGKLAAEEVFFRAFADKGFPVTVLRPAWLYGDGGTILHSLGWTTTFIDRLRKGRAVVVHGDGESLWSACHVDDAAPAFAAALEHPAAPGRAYTIAADRALTFNRYVRGVAQALGRDAELVHIPTDVLRRLAPRRAELCADVFRFNCLFDNRRSKSELGFAQSIDWVEGARRTIAWLERAGRIEPCERDPFDDRLIAAWRSATDALASSVREP